VRNNGTDIGKRGTGTGAPSKENRVKDAGFEVFTAVVLKSIIIWDMTPCSA
jgi:hypothetical protein